MLADKFYDLLIQEIDQNLLGLAAADHQVLRSYYRSLATRPAERRFFRYNWLQRTAPMVKALHSLPQSGPPLQILDAGCGVGSESIFMSLQRGNLKITGVDIALDRLSTAQARRQAYETYLQRGVPARFMDADVFDVLKETQFHLVWVMEAISHIDPAEDFLALVYRQLAPGGKLVISDSHLSNPAIAWEAYTRRRKGLPLRTTRCTSRGKQISYAHERVFSLTGICSRLLQAGFSQMETHLSVFFPPQVARSAGFFSLACAAESLFKRLPGVRLLGGIYTVVAHKNC